MQVQLNRLINQLTNSPAAMLIVRGFFDVAAKSSEDMPSFPDVSFHKKTIFAFARDEETHVIVGNSAEA